MINRFFLSLALLSVFIPMCATGQTPPNHEQDEKGIKQVLAGIVEAWNSHDAKAFSMVFAEDADFTNVVGMSAHGRTEIEKFHAPMFATWFKDTHLTMTDTKIRFITPEVAAVDAHWEMTGVKDRGGHDIPPRKGLLNSVMTHSKGQWLITVLHNMDLPQQ
jgi:uncharacterized protein (TIGR02246 family)